jgi:site-specific recombinase XerD
VNVRQLWKEASATFAIPKVRLRNQIHARPAPHLRALYWPNGHPCWEATAYIINECRRGLASSSANTYASELSHLIRFVSQRRGLRFKKITDDHLYEYAAYLARTDPRGRLIRQGSYINRVIGTAIRFLMWLGKIMPVDRRLVGYPGDDASITIYPIKGPRGVAGFSHPSYQAKSEPTKIRPMADLHLEQLLNAADEEGQRFFTRCRNSALINLLADSGVRREELSFIRVEDLEQAIERGGRLRCRTSKRKGNPYREVPVPLETLVEIRANYVETARAIRMETILGSGGRDEGWLFCTQTGSRMRPSTVTHLFARLRAVAGIDGKAAPHMLRHRWINLQVREGVRRLSALAPISAGLMVTLLSRLASTTGHASLQSLIGYLDDSFDQLTAELAHGREHSILEARQAVAELRKLLGKMLDAEGAGGLLDAILSALNVQSSLPRLSESAHIELGLRPRSK